MTTTISHPGNKNKNRN